MSNVKASVSTVIVPEQNIVIFNYAADIQV